MNISATVCRANNLSLLETFAKSKALKEKGERKPEETR
jgi:hypothetical protein